MKRRLLGTAVSAGLLFTVLLGLVFRWQMAGFGFDVLSSLDLRRAHSHLAFYGFVIPAVWFLEASSSAFQERKKLLVIYLCAVAISIFGFLIQSYGWISISGSTLVLGIWIVFAIDLIRSGKNEFLKPAPYFIFISALAIVAVAVLTKRDPVLGARVARSFLSCLLLGLLAPACASYFVPELKEGRRARGLGILWAVCALLSAAFLPGLTNHWAVRIGPVGLGSIIVAGTIAKLRSRPASDLERVLLYWMIFGLALIAAAAGVVQQNYFLSIAGIHFFVLGPIALTLVESSSRLKTKTVLRWSYELSFLLMAMAIGLQSIFPEHQDLLQILAAVFGTSTVVCLLLGLASLVSKK